ncbi:alpha/beta-hydrolase [Neocallimastix lanati (nom. inval.)]|jgi:esterase/lipase|uniref:Alpha/beta-hydrolase n=1 Tax=Neocallimastix californiae TaxID=1754190 RepID=A0A1Y2B2F7_9FUNG|nr:alpha/beta-hydrolase [Neocallimastix sp. JGI-2020a]ORY28677.1 alpha/beta-hydrolase [Neocallimastix californiae]|eukprot:ORY28677.1 alpha/beta-hydrolase [Neocallimastix californiae]
MSNNKKTKFTVKEDGFFGELFENENIIYKDKVLIVCPGSNGEFEKVKLICKGVSESGITTLGINYFNAPDTPSALCHVPLDYVENAAKYLKSIGFKKIGIWGISMGAVYALLCASYFPDLISLVVAASPMYYVLPAIDSKKNISLEGSAFSYKGEDIPFEPYRQNMTFFRNFFETIKHLEPNLSYLYDPIVGNVPENHIIPVEKMKARVILISGKLDNLWPSTKSGELIMERLKKYNYAYPYEHIICEHGSHLMVPYNFLNDKVFRACRSYPKDNERYRKEHYEKLVETFKIW